MKPTSSRSRCSHAAWLVLAGALFAAAGCHDSEARTARRPLVPVVVSEAVTRDIPVQIAVIGTVEAYSTVEIKSQVTGQLMKRFFDEGDNVQQGNLLFQLDTRPFDAAVRQAEAALARDVALADNAAREEKRYQGLVEKGFAPAEQYEQLRSAAAAQQAAVQVDRAALESSRLQLEFASIRAPLSGRTGAVKVKEGNLIKANDATLVVIQQMSPVYVTFSVPEKDLPDIRGRMADGELAVEAAQPTAATAPERGTLAFVDNTVDRATGTIMLKGLFENDARRLWPGEFVNATLDLATEKGDVVVPSRAVQTGQKGTYVWVLTPAGTVELRPVVTGLTYLDDTVIQRGLAAGEQVVVDGHLRLVPGAEVAVSRTPVAGR